MGSVFFSPDAAPSPWRRLLGALTSASFTLASLLVLSAAPAALAAPAAPQKPALRAEDKKAARLKFAEGKAAFAKRDYRHAAESFEAAYALAPHHDTLWNAARSWFRAGEKTRAANLYAQYLEEAPPRTRDRDSASDALRQLSTELARLEIHATDFTDVRVDNEPALRESVYVTPGTHVIQGRKGDRAVQKSLEAAAGAIVSVALVSPPPPPPPPPPAAPAASPPPPPSPAPPARGVSPLVLLVGGGLTVGAAGVLIWSGVDTLEQRRSFDAAPNQAKLDAGRSKQTRTNVLIGVTAGLAALTAATAVFVVDWHRGEKNVQVGLGPGSILVRRAF